MTTETKTRTITLTGRPPVRIKEDEWPILAEGRWQDYDSQVRQQANRTWDLSIRVRQHQDERFIVYGVYDYNTNFQGESGFLAKCGSLTTGTLNTPERIAKAIKAVGDNLRERMLDARGNAVEGCAHIAAVISECIGDLPAEEL